MDQNPAEGSKLVIASEGRIGFLRQSVLDDGNRGYGLWLIPQDEPDLPMIVKAK